MMHLCDRSLPIALATLRLVHWERAIFGFLIAAALATADLWAQASSPPPSDAPHVVFTKEFPNSHPDYFSVCVYENGRTLYSTAPNDEAPLDFQIPREPADEIFRLAEKLDRFQDRKLESGRRVASMGKKTLAYRKGEERYEAVYNHTEIPEALALGALFERISQTEQHLLRLQNLIRFDKLGVVKELLQFEIDLDHGRLLGAEQLVPILEKIRTDRSIANLAQERAVQILGKIQSGQQ